MKLSIIIPCYNAAATLGAQLDDLVTQTWTEPWEILVADNGSTDASRALVERYHEKYPHIRYVQASERRGAAYARNVGARHAHGDYLAFIDADDVANPGWLAAIGNALSQYDAVASRFDITTLNPEWLARAFPHPQEHGLQQINYPPFLPHAGGCGLAVRRAVHEKIGGFNEQLRFLQDTDYCFRLQQAGYTLHFEPTAVVSVRYRATTNTIFRQTLKRAEYNVLLARIYRPSNQAVNLRYAWKLYLRTWYSLTRRLRTMRTPTQRVVVLTMVAWQLGVLEGCLKYRTFPLPPLGLIEEARKIYNPPSGVISKVETP